MQQNHIHSFVLFHCTYLLFYRAFTVLIELLFLCVYTHSVCSALRLRLFLSTYTMVRWKKSRFTGGKSGAPQRPGPSCCCKPRARRRRPTSPKLKLTTLTTPSAPSAYFEFACLQRERERGRGREMSRQGFMQNMKREIGGCWMSEEGVRRGRNNYRCILLWSG